MIIGEGLFNLVKAAMVITRAGEDVAVMDFHCAPIRDGLIADVPAYEEEMDKIAARLQTFWDALDGYFMPESSYSRLVFHNAGPKVTDEAGFTLYPDGTRKKDTPHGEPANPAIRTDILTGNPGTSATARFMPPQVAVSVTFKTTQRRSWGRIYIPFGDSNHVFEGQSHALGAGQLDSEACEGIADAAEALVNGLAADNVPLVVWSPTHQVARSVDEVQVDSLFDVIRSRRYDRALHFEQRAIA